MEPSTSEFAIDVSSELEKSRKINLAHFSTYFVTWTGLYSSFHNIFSFSLSFEPYFQFIGIISNENYSGLDDFGRTDFLRIYDKAKVRFLLFFRKKKDFS